jgi:enterochelin esterase-like enzyme
MKITRKFTIIITSLIFFLSGCLPAAFSQEDHTHFSKTFDKEKPYRIFLPEDYGTSGKRYPVIYYFHGNKGSHVPRLSDTMAELVKKNQVILVAWNGRSVDSDVRPYNIGFHSNINYKTQFKDYFPELVSHIDSTYKTLTDRENRAVIGHSMGGIMSFFLAGNYPHMIGTAVNSKGSPEFFIGYPENHSLYSVRYFFKNLYGVKLRFHNSTNGELVYLNNEVHQGALREKDLDYEYEVYEGGHSLKPVDFTDAFNFVIAAFKDPLTKPERWHHADLYPDFEVWGYEVKSNLNEPGFIELHGVTAGGLGITTKKWQPEGITIPGVKINVKTAPLYQPDASYSLLDYNQTDHKKTLTTVKSDGDGRIGFSVDHQPHQIGIFKKNDPAEIVFLDYKVNGNDAFLDHKKESNLKLRLLNRGGSTAKGLKVTLSTTTKGVSIANPTITTGDIPSAGDRWLESDFKVTASNEPPKDGSPFRVRFYITVTDKEQNTWEDEFDALVYFDVPEFREIGVDDGDSEIFGNGNGNNIAEPGESIMIYQISHRTRLYYDDPYIDSERIHVDLQPDKWGDGYAVSSVVHISEDCPIGHKIKFLASYEVKEWKTIKRNVTWGTFTITVGKENNE